MNHMNIFFFTFDVIVAYNIFTRIKIFTFIIIIFIAHISIMNITKIIITFVFLFKVNIVIHTRYIHDLFRVIKIYMIIMITAATIRVAQSEIASITYIPTTIRFADEIISWTFCRRILWGLKKFEGKLHVSIYWNEQLWFERIYIHKSKLYK